MAENSGTSFLQIVVFMDFEKRAGVKSQIALFQERLINVAMIEDISEGKQYHDDAQDRDFETVYIHTTAGEDIEVEGTIPLYAKALNIVGYVAKVDPLDNNTMDDEGTSATEGMTTLDNAREEEPVMAGGGNDNANDSTAVPGGGGRARVGRGQRTNG